MIRDATEADLPQILAMLDEYLEEQQTLGSGTLVGPRTRESWRIGLLMLIDGDVEGCVLVAEGEGRAELVGFSALRTEQVTVDHIHSKVGHSIVSYVAPAQRRSGITREFLTRKLAIAKVFGCTAVLSTTRKANSAAAGVLVATGFKPHEVVYMHKLGGE